MLRSPLSPRHGLALLLLASVITACGGSTQQSEPEPKTVRPAHRHAADDGMTASAEIGGLNEDAVDHIFARAEKGITHCFEKGAQQNELLGGNAGFFITIGPDGSVLEAHMENSTLGDRATERCMLGVLKMLHWPKPVGGRTGQARKSFSFDMLSDAREPVVWESSKVSDELSKLRPAIDHCKKNSAGTFSATVYVGTNGEVLNASVAPPNAQGEEAVDCLIDTLKGAQFSSPGSYPAKVTFEL